MGVDIDLDEADGQEESKRTRRLNGGETMHWKPNQRSRFNTPPIKAKEVFQVMRNLEKSVDAEKGLPEYKRSILQQRRGYADVRGEALLRALRLSLPAASEEDGTPP
jgi:hypothetical protein